jgi:3-oxoacyl-[acyl-carrier-protein] synthase II
MRRVVVTGLGMVSPLACGVDATWKRLVDGRSGARRVETFDVSDLACKIACQVRRGDGSDGSFNADQWMPPKEQRKVDDFIIFAMSAASQALADAGWKPQSKEEQDTTGVLVGSGIGGLTGIAETSIVLKEKGPRRVSPFFIPGRLINLASGYISIEHRLRGPNHAVVTACSSGAHAIGDAGRLIALGDADVMVAGGTESPISRIGMAGFIACRALSTGFNDTPERASRPYDKDRDGFVMGEGAGVVVLEEYEHAKARGAKIYAEVAGYGLSSDATHVTEPDPTGENPARAMRNALNDAGVDPGEVDYINAHGTSTPLGDAAETRVIKLALGEENARKTPISSTKGATGHCLGAGGAVEAIFSTFAIRDGKLPPTINYEVEDPACDLDYIPNETRDADVRVAVSNAFGFGGHNASIVLKRLED